MAPQNPRPQAMFFYTREWSKDIDQFFGSMLAEEAAALGRTLRRSDSASFKTAIDKTNVQFNTRFEEKRGVDMFRKLKLRHSAYSHLLEMSGVIADDESKQVIVENEGIWDEILEFYAMSEAYMSGTEPLWNEMKVIFGYVVRRPPPLIRRQVIDLTQVVVEPNLVPAQIIEVSSEADEVPANIIRANVAHMHRRANNVDNRFWNDIIEDSHIVSSQESVAQGRARASRVAMHNSGTSSSRRLRGQSRRGALYIETSEDFQVIEEANEDRASSEASSPHVPRYRSFQGRGGDDQ